MLSTTGAPAATLLPPPEAGDRVLVVAPHPDDEAVGAGGLIAQALREGATVRLAFATSGENNPWAQRAFERRLLLDTRARIRFGVHREKETAASLACLGAQGQSPAFFHLVDQGLTSLLLHDPPALVDRLRAEMDDFAPTVVVGPWAGDLHPDHSALAVAMEMALLQLSESARPSCTLGFVVHNPPARRGGQVRFALDPGTVEAKRRAIGCHRSQLVWRGAFMRSFAAAEERYFSHLVPHAGSPSPIAAARWGADRLELEIHPRTRLRAPGPRTLLLLGASGSGAAAEVHLPLWTGRVPVRVVGSEERRGSATFKGGPRGGSLVLPPDLVADEAAAFVKLQRRFGFFDESGWVVVHRATESRQ